jgi:hypothetical protein
LICTGLLVLLGCPRLSGGQAGTESPERKAVRKVEELGGGANLLRTTTRGEVAEVAFVYTGISDKDLRHLAPLGPKLEVLSLSGNNITDHGVQVLDKFPKLRRLRLDATQITDKGLTHVGKLKHLEMLDLRATRISDRGLRELRGLAELRSLNLCGTRVTGRGLKDIARLASLTDLFLAATQVGDDGLREIVGLKHLGLLDLDQTKVTYEGLLCLEGLEDLKTKGGELYLRGIKISPAQLRRLQKVLRECRIITN